MKTTMLILAMTAFITIGIKGSAQDEKGESHYFFLKLDTMPQYPGGEEAFLKDVTEKVKFPEEAWKQGIAGKVYVGFKVDTEGKTKEAHIARGVGPILDKEALQVINQLKKPWNPGIKDGKKVDVYIVVLFDFKEDKEIDVSLAKSPR